MAERKYAQEVAKTAAAAVSVVNTPSPSATGNPTTASTTVDNRRSTTVDNRRSPAASAAGLTEKEKAAVSVCEGE